MSKAVISWLLAVIAALLLWAVNRTESHPIMIAVPTATPVAQTITDTVRIMFGPDEENIAYAMEIAHRESGPDFTQVIGDNGESVCAFQIHLPSHPGWSKELLLTPAGCAVAAWEISEHGTDWSQWTTHEEGRLR